MGQQRRRNVRVRDCIGTAKVHKQHGNTKLRCSTSFLSFAFYIHTIHTTRQSNPIQSNPQIHRQKNKTQTSFNLRIPLCQHPAKANLPDGCIVVLRDGFDEWVAQQSAMRVSTKRTVRLRDDSLLHVVT